MENQTMIITLKEYRGLLEVCKEYLQLMKEYELLREEYNSLLEGDKPKYEIGFREDKKR